MAVAEGIITEEVITEEVITEEVITDEAMEEAEAVEEAVQGVAEEAGTIRKRNDPEMFSNQGKGARSANLQKAFLLSSMLHVKSLYCSRCCCCSFIMDSHRKYNITLL
mmetsp:Transcript_31751/g.46689  ORF Transcript_31751/g.46689 Transcript_31751/m.46689 type:complete len:108 (-) Transcript_31751:1324-1647(-)